MIFGGNFSTSGDINFVAAATYTPTLGQITVLLMKRFLKFLTTFSLIEAFNRPGDGSAGRGSGGATDLYTLLAQKVHLRQ